jgi:hypothetical protein
LERVYGDMRRDTMSALGIKGEVLRERKREKFL